MDKSDESTMAKVVILCHWFFLHIWRTKMNLHSVTGQKGKFTLWSLNLSVKPYTSNSQHIYFK